jgi:hypothetical protein
MLKATAEKSQTTQLLVINTQQSIRQQQQEQQSVYNLPTTSASGST